ncbi:hypothetical protein [Paraburkholderia sp. BCC1885]|uniref:hypothetical protein n=1 Tax=Paraburkholderia sp. BCC1885 TaxID=2562669 RepID=UPI001182DD1A|nr:hypothetical protein [Paraburkholderia sp. BCC1885]
MSITHKPMSRMSSLALWWAIRRNDESPPSAAMLPGISLAVTRYMPDGLGECIVGEHYYVALN